MGVRVRLAMAVTAGLAAGCLEGCLKGPVPGAPPGRSPPAAPAPPISPALPRLQIDPVRLVLVVTIEGHAFKPAKIAIGRGSSVRFVNQDVHPHTATSDDPGGWGTPLLKKGESAEETFEVAGLQPYHCEPHPWMTATIEVR